jgi:hypothetical protein
MPVSIIIDPAKSISESLMIILNQLTVMLISLASIATVLINTTPAEEASQEEASMQVEYTKPYLKYL